MSVSVFALLRSPRQWLQSCLKLVPCIQMPGSQADDVLVDCSTVKKLDKLAHCSSVRPARLCKVPKVAWVMGAGEPAALEDPVVHAKVCEEVPRLPAAAQRPQESLPGAQLRHRLGLACSHGTPRSLKKLQRLIYFPFLLYFAFLDWL